MKLIRKITVTYNYYIIINSPFYSALVNSYLNNFFIYLFKQTNK